MGRGRKICDGRMLAYRDDIPCRICKVTLKNATNLQKHFDRRHKTIVIARANREKISNAEALSRIRLDHLHQDFAVIDELSQVGDLRNCFKVIPKEITLPTVNNLNSDIGQIGQTESSNLPNPRQSTVNEVEDVQSESLDVIDFPAVEKPELDLDFAPSPSQPTIKRSIEQDAQSSFPPPPPKKLKQSMFVACLACEKLKPMLTMVDNCFDACEEIIKGYCYCNRGNCCCSDRLLSAKKDTKQAEISDGDISDPTQLELFGTTERGVE